MTLRIFEEAENEGGETFECLRTLARIRPGTFKEDWYAEWYAIGEKVARMGEQALKEGHHVSARKAFLRAYNYYRLSYFYMSGKDSRKKEAYVKGHESFQKATQLFDPKFEYVEVPFEGKVMEGVFYPAESKKAAPLVVFVGGIDGQKEEAYFVGAKELQERGINVLAIDGPGQASALIMQQLVCVPNYEKPVGAFLDQVAKRRGVDMERVAILGRSLGGYIAPRVAAFEKRIKACVVWGAYYDMQENIKHQGKEINEALKEMLAVETDEELREKAKAYTLNGVIQRVQCPILIIHGEADPVTPAWNAQRTYDEAKCEKTLKMYKLGEPGSGHCTHDAPSIVFPLVYDWLYDKLTA
jgi:dipeptidyl aminopeptidase/acylaminoacyl peptidase